MDLPAGQIRLLAGLRQVVERLGSEPAVREPDGAITTYDELARLIAAVRTGLETDAERPVGLLFERSAAAYASMWAAISLGRAYVPLNTSYPPSRLVEIIDQAGIDQVVTTAKHAPAAHDLGINADHLVIVDELDVAGGDVDSVWEPKTGSDTAYMLFTSGSTGAPKGVPISYDNLWAFTSNIMETIPYVAGDICSQVCELSFDFSVHEIYAALLSGASLCPARGIDLFNPAHYVAHHGITVWISVPSLARVALNYRKEGDDQLDSLRLAIFNGEALTSGIATQWQNAAPNVAIWNNYGPTECTVAVTTQLWKGEPELEEVDVVAIGRPFADGRTALAAGDQVISTDVAEDGMIGELLLAGPQRFAGYLDEALASPFIEAGDQTWYRTGDRVRWRDGRLYHLGRLDHQVKIGGHRIELLEIEHRLRGALGREAVAVIAHPKVQPTELILFVTEDLEHTPTAADTGLPTYMMPKRTITVPAMPLSSHGKLDRGELHHLVEAQP